MDKFTFKDIRDEFTEDIRSKSTAPSQSNADTRIDPPGYIMNKKFANALPRIRDFVVYPDDTWVISFPKSGTTWTQEMVWLLKNNLDYDNAKSIILRHRFPFLELHAISDQLEDESVLPDTIEVAAKTPRPRFIKTHLPPQLLPKQLWTVKPKIVCVTRNPSDALISYYHHHRIWNGYTGSLQDFFRVFLADRVVYAPYWNHIKSWWPLRKESHVLYNTYEEMKADLASVVARTAKFLEVEISEEQMMKLCQHLSFASMKDNESVNYMDAAKGIIEKTVKDPELTFIRSGESGGWRKHFTSEMTAQIDAWTRKHLSGSELTKYPTTACAQTE